MCDTLEILEFSEFINSVWHNKYETGYPDDLTGVHPIRVERITPISKHCTMEQFLQQRQRDLSRYNNYRTINK